MLLFHFVFSYGFAPIKNLLALSRRHVWLKSPLTPQTTCSSNALMPLVQTIW